MELRIYSPGGIILQPILALLLGISVVIADELGNLVQEVNVECNPSDIRLKIRTSEPYAGRIYPRGLGKSICERSFSPNNGNSSSNSSTLTEFIIPLTSCNTVLQDIPTGLEYQNTIVIQVHRSLVTQSDKIYNVRCKYEAMNTTIVASMNMSDTLPAMQLESTALLPPVSMTIYKGSSESRVMADFVTIGDPVALVINLPRQATYGMLVKDCVVKDGVDMGGSQPLIDSKGCPVDSTLFGSFVYSADLTQAYVIFRAHKFPYTDSLFYECAIKFCLKVGGDCQRLSVPPNCDRQQQRYRRASHNNDTSHLADDKMVAVVRGITVREPTAEASVSMAEQSDLYPATELAQPVNTSGQWCVPRSTFAIILAVSTFLIVVSTTVFIAMVLEKRRRRVGKKTNSDVYSSIYMSHYGAALR
ncbi:putative Cuticlin-1 [Hypsibius exemplaris]|uniref:Cuticlin-1 n=1 Tax=Hypsibius exemplaris TaxID=2072580 RepID=A0A1W0X6P3_HYPEX|nr:putative Cuticlin-1 [Hypsibius exemplaris]